jgi:hypothetical protein
VGPQSLPGHCRLSNPDRPVPSPSLYRLSYPDFKRSTAIAENKMTELQQAIHTVTAPKLQALGPLLPSYFMSLGPLLKEQRIC